MALPLYQAIMLPLLTSLRDGKQHKFGELVEELAEHFSLTEEERKEPLPSGTQPMFTNRVGWARFYLKKAELLDSPERGFSIITDSGRKLLDTKPTKIDNSVLKKYSAFTQFLSTSKATATTESVTGDTVLSETPDEAFGKSYAELRAQLASELLDQIKSASPEFFEKLVLDVLLKMGYGGNRTDAGKALGKSGDEGIDGVINEDPLGLDKIYIQAKRWEGSVGRPAVQAFAGALHGQQASRGVFITTSSFSKDARDFVSKIQSSIVLIDGEKLTQLMIDYGVGVVIKDVYELKKVDSDYFKPE